MLSYYVGLKRKASSSEGAFLFPHNREMKVLLIYLRGLELMQLDVEDLPEL